MSGSRLFGVMSLFASLWLSVPARSDQHCRARTIVREHHEIPAVLFVPVPAYSIGYQPAAKGGEETDIERLRLEVEILKLKIQLKAKESAPESVLREMPKRPDPPPASAAVQHCARCHDAAVAANMGDGHVFFRNGVLSASAEQRLDMSKAIMEGKMPKGKDPGDKEITQILLELATRQKSL